MLFLVISYNNKCDYLNKMEIKAKLLTWSVPERSIVNPKEHVNSDNSIGTKIPKRNMTTSADVINLNIFIMTCN